MIIRTAKPTIAWKKNRLAIGTTCSFGVTNAQRTFPSCFRSCPDPICLRGPFLFSSMMSSIGGFGLLQHHDSSQDSLKVTMIKSNSAPWLDKDKVISLVVLDGPLKGQVFPITKPKLLLGRSEGDIVLEDPEISRKHCAIEVHGPSAVLADLGSTNGTFVDDKRIETHQLQHMSEFRLDSTVVMFSARAKD
jgi:hypothetical protein